MESKNTNLPVHIGIIMDGNGRWAEERGLPRSQGHKKGAEVFREICRHCGKLGIKYVTFFAFSTENWKRSEKEVNGILSLFREFLRELDEKKDGKEKFTLRFLGSREGLPAQLKELMEKVESSEGVKEGLHVNIAFNYGAREEILHAVRQLSQGIKDGSVSINDIDEESFSSLLYTKGQPDPDLIIRPSGEYRLSNFLLWQSAYSEIYIDSVLWPDYRPEDLDRAINEYSKRNRRFGGV